jgi:hypothetical protein
LLWLRVQLAVVGGLPPLWLLALVLLVLLVMLVLVLLLLLLGAQRLLGATTRAREVGARPLLLLLAATSTAYARAHGGRCSRHTSCCRCVKAQASASCQVVSIINRHGCCSGCIKQWGVISSRSRCWHSSNGLLVL